MYFMLWNKMCKYLKPVIIMFFISGIYPKIHLKNLYTLKNAKLILGCRTHCDGTLGYR